MYIFPELHTQRLHLRQLQINDIPALVKYANNKKIADQIVNIPHPYGEPQAVFRISYVVQGFNKRERFVFAIIKKDQSELIGEISLHLDKANNQAELGYWVGEPFWNQGFATEAAEAVLEFGFKRLHLDQIFATCHESNGASSMVAEHISMREKSKNGKVSLYAISKQTYSRLLGLE